MTMLDSYIYNFLRQNKKQEFTARQIAYFVNKIYSRSFSAHQIANTIKNWSSCYGWNIHVDKSQRPFKYNYV